MTTLRVRDRIPGAGAALVSFGAILILLLLLWGATAAEAHPGMQAEAAPAVALDTPSEAPTPGSDARIAPISTLGAAAATSDAWTWLLLLVLPALAAVRSPRAARGLALAVALVLAVFACETAVHSVHHLKDPRQAERCPVYSASQQLTGLTAAPATPDLPPPVPTLDRPAARAVQAVSRVLDGEQSRAPPLRPA